MGPIKATRTTLGLAIALALALASLAFLVWQNRGLRQDRAELERRTTQPYVEMWLPEIWTKTLDGVPIRLGTPPDRYQVLYFFAPDCADCQRSAASARELAQRLNRDPRVQMVGVANGARDAVRRDVARQEFRFPVAVLSDRRALGLFKANALPLLLVADADGLVRFWHVGAIENRAVSDDALAAMGLAEGTGEPIVIDRAPTADTK